MKLIIITGAPASGKSSISKRIGDILNIDVVSRDEFKIYLFDKFGFKNHDEKKKLSLEAEKLMNDTIFKYILKNESLIVDNNFKNFNNLRDIIEKTNKNIDIYCINCVADYNILAKRYNERILNKNRHPGLYTLNCYPVIEGISERHPLITEIDVSRIQKMVNESTFGEKNLEINTNNIELEFEKICSLIISFIEKEVVL